MATNIDIVRTGYDSFSRGDIQTTLAMFAEDIEWHEPEWTYGPASGSFKGATRCSAGSSRPSPSSTTPSRSTRASSTATVTPSSSPASST